MKEALRLIGVGHRNLEKVRGGVGAHHGIAIQSNERLDAVAIGIIGVGAVRLHGCDDSAADGGQGASGERSTDLTSTDPGGVRLLDGDGSPITE